MDIILKYSRFSIIFVNYNLNTTTMTELDEIEMESQEAGGIIRISFSKKKINLTKNSTDKNCWNILHVHTYTRI